MNISSFSIGFVISLFLVLELFVHFAMCSHITTETKYNKKRHLLICFLTPPIGWVILFFGGLFQLIEMVEKKAKDFIK